jgi:hypothetical protein
MLADVVSVSNLLMSELPTLSCAETSDAVMVICANELTAAQQKTSRLRKALINPPDGY